MISSHSATTSGSSISPPAWVRARMSIASCTRPTFASHLGDRGKKGKPHMRKTAGTNWMPHAVRKEAGPGMKLQPYPMKYMMKIPHSMAHCWMTTIEPRTSFFAISTRYTGTCEDVIPTQIPLMNRPATSMPMPLQEVWRAVPMSQNTHANQMESRRPNLFEIGPAMMAPMTEPPANAAPIPPWVVPWGLLKYDTYCFVPMMALMLLISKPNL